MPGPGREQSAQEPREDGQIMVMIIGYVTLALLVATVVMGISSVYIEHKRLLSMADGASLAAADSYTLGQLDAAAGTPAAVLHSDRVRSVAADYLARTPSSQRFDRLAVVDTTGSPDGSTAVVVLAAAVHPPVINFLVPDGIMIEATSTARARLQQ
ncbi:pilus assembly protein TadG-related protein [Pseudarthrobacter sp. J75]|uniref:pilus assembly protein TadG-related protein n=1 Tax=unclassified Pseudarthrobacter TaxID=2647000 RepID=UPI002E802520|nr:MULTISPECIES: pilus assembly protein TadG-related protein [unclassified Pseudarthrobacter]MEE2521412.1 pilus assembly protein TadG-related protein [Pseudarthrobacter sp. J47]MEE2528644.1 pilus assembly protein TadG-related protein [Pseudarthrobacter sp. J75]MEE2568335.1 pilus assembly protein TadG-related protein [Pseudarthrobacter sp. J64]